MKRFFDIIFSAFAILLFFPFMLLISAVIFLDDGFPVVFRQDRIGKDGKIFKIRKFRTMKKGTRNAATRDLKEFHECVTRSGRFIRRSSIDELLQLFNILEGSMSFIGPRPLIPEEIGIHELRTEAGVYKVRPGMTGLAQVSGRDNITHEEKVKYDIEYVENMSVHYDIIIIIKTLKAVLKGENVVEGEGCDEKEDNAIAGS